jgi:histidyl-tRNA synthetase
MELLRAVKGMNDILPEDVARWQRLEALFRGVTARWGFVEVRTPIVEPTQLFVRSIGDATDIVEKEMYTFVDKGDDSLTLRPEGTAGCVRAYLEHTVHAREPVAKWIYSGPMFRRERPARGRYRQFHQLGAEIYGDPGPYADAELVDMLLVFLREAGLVDLEVLLNSLGSGDTRVRYRDALVAYFTPHREALSDESKRRLETNPLRILDSKSPADQEIGKGAPRILDFLSDEDRTHFDELRRALDRFGVPHRVEPSIVRGLDYYTRTLFEVKGRGGELGAQDTICGGGRYDGLVAELGGPPTPAIGFAIGIERLLLATTAAASAARADVFVATVSPELRLDAAVLLRELRAAGLVAEADLRGGSLKSQMRRADKTGARLALILGGDEIARGVVQARDLANKVQSEVARDGIVAHAAAVCRERA